jgi:ABC-type phosphate transport system substrate-binding protein
MKIANLSALVALLLLAAPGVAFGAGGFKLVVNAEQRTEKLTKDDVSRIFLKKMTRWSDGTEIRVVQPKGDSAVRSAFDGAIHGRSPAAIRNYWAQMVFSGRDVPPVEKANDEAIVDFVKQSKGAIGVVSEGAALGGGVKVVDLK